MSQRRPSIEPQTIADMMPRVLRRLGGGAREREHLACRAYEAVVGDLLRQQTRPEHLRERTLWVRVPSAALAHEVAMLKGEILQRIQGHLSDLAVSGHTRVEVTDVRTKVGR